VVATLALTECGVEALHAVGVFRAAAAAVAAAPSSEEVMALCHGCPRHAAALPAHETLQVYTHHGTPLFPEPPSHEHMDRRTVEAEGRAARTGDGFQN
jgi:hypothetical protein